jgi:hypothetical protein
VRDGAAAIGWGTDQTTLWSVGSGGEDLDTIQCTQKPVECMDRCGEPFRNVTF